LVGLTIHCHILLHIQSQLLATDRIGLETLLFPSPTVIENFRAAVPPHNPKSKIPAVAIPGINSCPHNYWDAVAIEVHVAALIKAAGYKIDVMMMAFHGIEDFEKACWRNGDPQKRGHYFNIELNPYELVFTKANRNIYPLQLERYTSWANGKNYSSYDYCKV
jgi:hypothetical protein